MSRVIQDMDLTYAEAVALLKPAMPQGKTMTIWYFSRQGTVHPPSIFFWKIQKGVINHQQTP